MLGFRPRSLEGVPDVGCIQGLRTLEGRGEGVGLRVWVRGSGFPGLSMIEKTRQDPRGPAGVLRNHAWKSRKS